MHLRVANTATASTPSTTPRQLPLRRLAILLGLCAAIAVAAAPTVASSAGVLIQRNMVDGYAYALYGNCDVPLPADGTVCNETEIIAFREAVAQNGGPVAPARTPWTLLVTHISTTWNDGNFTIVSYAVGVTNDVMASFDQAQLDFLTADGRVLLDDGTTADVHVSWRATAPVARYGNDGPTNAEEGIPRHYVDRCVTANANAHQEFRVATMTGTVNGAPVQSYRSFDASFIAKNHFVYVTVEHSAAC
jgi:hypothetical protein